MNKEEKKAIEYWKRDIELYHYNTQLASEHYAQTLLNLIQKQEKIIDKMAEYIKDLDESICIENTINPQLCNEQLSNCKECIKEYFKKEVEKECEN